MDDFTIDTFSPQEDEFALLSLGVPSVYRGFLDPRRLAELTHWLTPEAWSSHSPNGWAHKWREFLDGVTDGKQGRLLLKSPSHTFRIRALMELFPEAVFIWVVRDPIATFLSNRKMWLSMFERYALWDWDMAELDAFLLKAFESSASCLDYATRMLPTNRLAIVDFARLTSATTDTMDAVNLRLFIGDRKQITDAVARVAARKKGYNAGNYPEQLLDPVAFPVINRLLAAQGAALVSHGI